MIKYFIFFISFLFCQIAVADDAADWKNIYHQIQSNYIRDISVAQLAVTSLKGLQTIDSNLRLANDNNRLSLYYRGKVIKVVNKPDDNDADAWGKTTADIISAALQSSPKADEKSFQITDSLGKAMLNVLDDDSEFYASIDDAGGLVKRNKRYCSDRLLDNTTLYVKITAINKQTKHDLTDSLKKHPDVSKLIIDIRGCLGGMAGEAIKIADLFLNNGIIASTHGKDPLKQIFYTADENELFSHKTIEILTDGQTASAAEILAAALQEQGRATILGEKTFGKGSTQKLILLPSGGVLAVTSGYFQTPSGREIHGQGITPDIINNNPYQTLL